MEVAAYRIVVEALADVARHANAAEASGLIDVDSSPCGSRCGTAAARLASRRGITAMRERATEVGGQMRGHATGSGGLVRAELPPG